MKNRYKLKMLLFTCLMTLGFMACDNDNLDTNQYKEGVSLNVFGPSPVVRGGTLRFLGSNLDRVTEVRIPGVSPITEIEVRQSGVPSEILVQVPKDGPEEGIVTLVTSDGVEIQTKTELTYEETIVFDSFTPASVMPGDILTITGDYLNLIHEVIFADEVVVPESDFVSHTRYEIQLVVPVTAQTGEVILSDAAEDLPNWIYSETELEVGQPVVEGGITTSTRFKVGEEMTITGTDLNLVAYVRFGADSGNPYNLPASDLAEEGEASFTLNEDGTLITFALPAEAPAGAVELVLRSGLTLALMDDFLPVVPTGLAVIPATVKNGADMTVTGTDIDLVVSATFPNVADAIALKEAGTDRIVITVPDAAQSGDLALNMANGQQVTVAWQTLKPAITSFSPATLTAGEDVTITGTDLDLVAKLVFEGEGNPAVEINAEENFVDASTLKITVPVTALACAPKLVMKNGEEIETTVVLNITPATDPVVTAINPVSAKAGEEITVTGMNLNTVEAFFFGDVKVVKYGTRTESEVTLTVPDAVTPGTYNLRMLNYEGKEILAGVPVTIAAAETTIWTGPWTCSGWAGNQDLAWGGYDWTTFNVGQTIIFVVGFIDPTSGWAAISPRMGAGWANLSVAQIDLVPGADDQRVEFTPTEDDVNHLRNDGGLVITGDGFILKEVLIR